MLLFGKWQYIISFFRAVKRRRHRLLYCDADALLVLWVFFFRICRKSGRSAKAEAFCGDAIYKHYVQTFHDEVVNHFAAAGFT